MGLNLYLGDKLIAKNVKPFEIKNKPLEIFQYIGIEDGAYCLVSDTKKAGLKSLAGMPDDIKQGDRFKYLPAWQAHDWVDKMIPEKHWTDEM